MPSDRALFVAGSGAALVAAVAVGVGVWLLWKNREKFNPASRDNLAYQGAGAAARAVTGDSYDTFGTALWKWLNPTAAAAERQITAPVVPGGYVDRPGASWSAPGLSDLMVP